MWQSSMLISLQVASRDQLLLPIKYGYFSLRPITFLEILVGLIDLHALVLVARVVDSRSARACWS